MTLGNYFRHAPLAAGTAGYYSYPHAPEFPGVQYARETITPSAVYVDGPYAVLRFPTMTPGELETLLTQDGFTSASVREAELVVQLPNESWTAGVDYTCLAKRPRYGVDGGFDRRNYHGITYLLYRLAAL